MIVQSTRARRKSVIFGFVAMLTVIIGGLVAPPANAVDTIYWDGATVDWTWRSSAQQNYLTGGRNGLASQGAILKVETVMQNNQVFQGHTGSIGAAADMNHVQVSWSRSRCSFNYGFGVRGICISFASTESSKHMRRSKVGGISVVLVAACILAGCSATGKDIFGTSTTSEDALPSIVDADGLLTETARFVGTSPTNTSFFAAKSRMDDEPEMVCLVATRNDTYWGSACSEYLPITMTIDTGEQATLHEKGTLAEGDRIGDYLSVVPPHP